MTEPLIQVYDLYKIYDSYGIETAVIKGISFQIEESDKLILIGPSGSGKTTLVNLLTGMIKPSAGQIFWSAANKEINKIPDSKLLKIRRQFMGLVKAENYLLPQLNVKDNILLQAHLADLSFDDVKEQYLQLIEIINIEHILDRKPSSLSQGEMKRVNIAAALITNPKVLIADEPTEGIDPVVGDEILNLFEVINYELGTAFILTTHDQSTAERGNRVLELKNGVLSGVHNNELILNDLDTTRRLLLDKENRINIPKTILEQLNYPNAFSIRVDNGGIFLEPTDSLDRDGKTQKYECVYCQKVLNSSICDTCGKATIKL